MTIHLVFSGRRLLVGWRRRDYHDVWYEPILTHDVGSEQKADGTFKMQLTLGSTGIHVPESDPDPEEVLWYPQFDWKNCEAEGKKVQQKMQRKILYDAWRYCATTDEHQVKQLEVELENRDFVRWDSWFRHAKKWKEGQMKRKGKRRVSRKTRNDQARRNGVSNEDIEQSLMETSEEDEAYETDLQAAEREKAAKKPRGAMAPPLPPSTNPSGGQRRGRGTGRPPTASKKRARPGAKAPKGSDGLPSRSGRNTLGSNRPIVDDTEDDNDEEDDDETSSHPWDSRPPEGPSRSGSAAASPAAPANDYDGRAYMMGEELTTPGAPRRTSAADLASRFGGRRKYNMPTPSATQDSAPARREGSVLRDEDRTNNNLDDDEALNAALEASMQPDEDDVKIQRAIEASVEPESQGVRDGSDGGDDGAGGDGSGRDSAIGPE